MTEQGTLRLARRTIRRKGSGEGRTSLPVSRKYEREMIEQKPKHGGNGMQTRLEDLPPLARRYVEQNEMRLTDRAGGTGGDGWTMTLTDSGDPEMVWVGVDQARSEEAAFQKLTADLDDGTMQGFIDGLDKEAAINNTGTPEMRLSGAALLDRDAVQLVQGDASVDYGQAVGQVVKLAGSGGFKVTTPAEHADYPARPADEETDAEQRLTAEDVEQVAKDRNLSFGMAAKTVVRERADWDEETHGSVHEMDPSEYGNEMERLMKERGYDVD